MTILALTYSFSYLEPICCSMSSSNCFLLSCIKFSQEPGKMVWYSLVFKYFPQFAMIHTIKGFSVVSEAEVDVFLEYSCFSYDPTDVGNLVPVSSAFSKSNLYTSASSRFMFSWSYSQWWWGLRKKDTHKLLGVT